jgi:hypothetical protein
MPVPEMARYDLEAFFNYVIGVLERLEIPYMVVGGFAAIAYGVPRSTVDVDIVVDMRMEQAQPFIAAFPDSDFYVSVESVRDSLARRHPFNVIEMATAAKVDLVPLPRDVFTRMVFGRRQRIEYVEGHSATFIAPEDVIVAKLLAHKNTGSDKHLRDAQGVLTVQWGDLNLDLIRKACRASEVLEPFERVLEAARREVEGVQDKRELE